MSFIETLGQQMGGQAASGALGTVMGLMMEKHNDQRQIEQQQKMQNMQIAGSKQLTDYSYEKQLQMWKDTNYEAQMEQLKKAGLNPGLMYGMGGGGGQTTGSGVAKAESGQAQQNPGEVQQFTGMGLQLGMQAAQIELMKAEANKANTEAKKLGGVDTEKTTTEIQSLKVGMKTQEGIQAMQKAETYIKNLQGTFDANTMEDRMEQIKWNLKNTMAQVGIAQNEEYMSNATVEDKIKIVQQEAIGSVLRNALTQAQTDATRMGIKVDQAEIQKIQAEIAKWQTEIAQKWVELQQKGTGLSIEQQKVEIQKFTSTFQANYPGIGQTLGRLVNDGIESIFETFKGGRPVKTEGVK